MRWQVSLEERGFDAQPRRMIWPAQVLVLQGGGSPLLGLRPDDPFNLVLSKMPPGYLSRSETDYRAGDGPGSGRLGVPRIIHSLGIVDRAQS